MRLRSAALIALSAITLSAGPAIAERVGVAAAVNQAAESERAGARRTIVIGADVVFQERIITNDAGLAQVLFEDGSTFTVGPGAQVTIDEFVYNPATQAGELAASVTTGALRFVGGRISKNNNAVRFKTRSGTLVVRGGILNLDLSPPCLEDGRCPSATASLVFGEELIVTLPNGRVTRIYESGYSFALFGSGNATTANVVPTTLLNQSSLQQQLSGRPGTNGGVRQPPTPSDVVNSGVVEINSGRAPQVVLPRPKPITVQTKFTPEVEVLGVSSISNIVQETIVEQSEGDFIRDEVENTPVPEPTTVRILRTPETFTTNTGAVVTAPGVVNIVGGSAATDSVSEATLLRDLDGNTVGLVVGGDELAVPSTPGASPIAPFNSALFGETATGSAFVGEDEFLFFYLQPDRADGASDEVAYIFDGVPAAADTVFTGDRVLRTYELSAEFQREGQGIPSGLLLLNPLVAQAFGDSLANATETPFFIVSRSNANAQLAQGLYAGILIDGQGAGQQSAVALDISRVDQSSGNLTMIGQRRGSYRLSAGEASVGLAGDTLARASADGTSSFFGTNAQNFVYSSGPDRVGDDAAQNATVFEDRVPSNSGIPAGPNQIFSAMTSVASLVSTQDLASVPSDETVLAGYAAAMIEPVNGTPVPMRSFALGGFELAADPSSSTLGGRIIVVDTEDVDPVAAALVVSFGNQFPDQSPGFSSTRSAFIDQDTFGATSAGPQNATGSPTTLLITDNDGAFAQDPDVNPGTYVVSSDTVPTPQFFADAGVTPCECRFMEWGWWGTDTTFKADALPDGERNDHAHLGTWVAGDITQASDLPTTGTGTYSGHAVGNVANGANQYVAAGELGLTFDFGARTGNLSISNFDGRNVSGNVASFTDNAGRAQFFGSLAGSGLNGSAAGAFANGPQMPAQGVLGAFDLSGDNYRAAGTFIGER